MPGDLYYGDNLDVLRHKIASESVDLIYLDPPFNSNATYNLIHKESKGQERAFFDTWNWDDSAERAFGELTGHAPQTVRVSEELSDMMVALKKFLWRDHRDLLAYLSMMAIRLVELRRVLRPTGSLYLHCDPTASHYLKLILDSIFGHECFRNEIIWRYRRWPTKARRFQRMHDVLLFYTARKDNEHVFETLYGYEKLADSTLKTFGTRKQKADFSSGHRKPSVEAGETKGPPLSDFWDLEDLEAEGFPLSDAWEVGVIAPIGKERTGYPTQKPEKLLERVIRASSRPGELVLDPFCGCGTAIAVAQREGRPWIGIDVAIRAIDVVKDRLDKTFPGKRVWTEYGEPSDVDSAAHLAETNPYDFQWWAVRKLGGQPPKGEKKKGGDGGIDGEMTLRDFDADKRRRVIISVKGGRTLTPDFVKALRTTVDMEKADYGILLTMHAPSQGMRDVARDCGTVPWAKPADGKLGHRIRIVTVPEMFAGTVQLPGRNETPHTQSSPAPAEAREGETLHLPFAPRIPTAGSVRKAKVRNPGPAKTPARPTVEVRRASDSGRPKK
jgi:site-specific DNA-methyltransferase (adenine-specific)